MAEGGSVAVTGSDGLQWIRPNERRHRSPGTSSRHQSGGGSGGDRSPGNRSRHQSGGGSGEDRFYTHRYDLRSRNTPRQDESNAAARTYVPETASKKRGGSGQGQRGGQNAQKRQRTRSGPKPYGSLTGNDQRTHLTIKRRSKHGKGLCLLIVNHAHLIPGIEKDICDLEAFYSETPHYTVCGGSHDPEMEHYRDFDRDDFKSIIARINTQYDVNFRIRGAEYDRIFIHFFSVGDRESMHMSDESEISNLDLLNDLDTGIPNLQEHIPVVLYLHAHPLRPLTEAERANNSLTETHVSSGNVLGVFSVTHPILGHDQLQMGSWIIHELVVKLHYYHHSMHLCDILGMVSEDARRHQHPELIGIQKAFKDLFLTMGANFY